MLDYSWKYTRNSFCLFLAFELAGLNSPNHMLGFLNMEFSFVWWEMDGIQFIRTSDLSGQFPVAEHFLCLVNY